MSPTANSINSFSLQKINDNLDTNWKFPYSRDHAALRRQTPKQQQKQRTAHIVPWGSQEEPFQE